MLHGAPILVQHRPLLTAYARLGHGSEHGSEHGLGQNMGRNMGQDMGWDMGRDTGGTWART